MFAVWPWHPVDLTCTHIGEGLNSAYLSLGSTTRTSQGTQKNRRPLMSCREVIPHSLLCLPWEVVMKQFLIISKVQIRFGAFWPAHLRLRCRTEDCLAIVYYWLPSTRVSYKLWSGHLIPFVSVWSFVVCGARITRD